MIGAVKPIRKANSVKPKQFKVYEDPQDQQSIHVTPVAHVMKLKEVHVNIQAQKDTMRRLR